MRTWDECSKEEQQGFYESYVSAMISEWGKDYCIPTFEEVGELTRKYGIIYLLDF